MNYRKLTEYKPNLVDWYNEVLLKILILILY